MAKLLLSIISLFMIVGLLGCGGSDSVIDKATGSISLNITDAPILDEDNVTGVFISVTEIQYHGPRGWSSLKDFNTSMNPINLLDLQDGNALALAKNVLPAGKYTQVRFILEAAEESQAPKSNTGCFIQFDGDRNETLYVPSGSKTGYKAIGNFDVPVNGSVSITADFDVRKSITLSNNQTTYKLKPTLRIIVDNQSGKIKGSIANLNPANTYVIYAYEAAENVNVVAEAANDFMGALTSTNVKDGGAYTLAFLAQGDYDLIVVEYDANGDYVGHNIQIGLSVQSETTTRHDFDF
ncbi:MAG: hypothetical protein COA44_08480 [Arcobacter sp.]|nr:MAG: hypothetical protein COA44_08480 [Arcobacter sp.]